MGAAPAQYFPESQCAGSLDRAASRKRGKLASLSQHLESESLLQAPRMRGFRQTLVLGRKRGPSQPNPLPSVSRLEQQLSTSQRARGVITRGTRRGAEAASAGSQSRAETQSGARKMRRGGGCLLALPAPPDATGEGGVRFTEARLSVCFHQPLPSENNTDQKRDRPTETTHMAEGRARRKGMPLR